MAVAASPIIGAFGATGQSPIFRPAPNQDFNLVIGTPGVVLGGSVRLERSFDDGATWSPVTYIDGTIISWTSGVNAAWSEGQVGMAYRLNCTSFTTSIPYRVSQ